MEKKLMLLLFLISAFVLFFGVKGITGAVAGDVPGAGFLSRTTIVSVIGIIAIAGLVVATQVISKK